MIYLYLPQKADASQATGFCEEITALKTNRLTSTRRQYFYVFRKNAGNKRGVCLANCVSYIRFAFQESHCVIV